MTVSPPVDTRTVTIDVRGVPVPQGSMKAHATGNGKVALRYPAKVWEWRSQVQQAVVDTMMNEGMIEQLTGPVELRLGFELPRPVSHYGTGKNFNKLKPSAPAWPAKMPDLDKLTRCVCDAITDAGLWADDGQVVVIHAAKRYADRSPGVRITVTELMERG